MLYKEVPTKAVEVSWSRFLRSRVVRVPGAGRVPNSTFWGIIPWKYWRRAYDGRQPGTGPRPLEENGSRVSVIICKYVVNRKIYPVEPWRIYARSFKILEE